MDHSIRREQEVWERGRDVRRRIQRVSGAARVMTNEVILVRHGKNLVRDQGQCRTGQARELADEGLRVSAAAPTLHNEGWGV